MPKTTVNRTVNVTFTMTQDEAEVVKDALNIYTRFGLGQFERLIEVYERTQVLNADQFSEVRRLLLRAKEVVGHPDNGSFGIGNPKVSEVFRASNNLQKYLEDITK